MFEYSVVHKTTMTLLPKSMAKDRLLCVFFSFVIYVKTMIISFLDFIIITPNIFMKNDDV